jgi:hypothetical protein
MLATTAYVYGGRRQKSFVTFSWCLADFDRNPQPWHRTRLPPALALQYDQRLLNFPECRWSGRTRCWTTWSASTATVTQPRAVREPARVARHVGAADRGGSLPAVDDHARFLSGCAGRPSSRVSYLSDLGRLSRPSAGRAGAAGRLTCTEQPRHRTSLLLPTCGPDG